MLQIILLLLPGVVSKDWNVRYPPNICAARGSNVTINCTFTYPNDYNVQRVMWCSMRSNSDTCRNPPYVYDSEANNNQNNFQYIGDKISDCSLLISNINLSHSGEYKFRFITDKTEGRWTGKPGGIISVNDLRVSMRRSRENGSTISGDSLSLTCTLNCSGELSEVQWFKNGDVIQHSEPVLTFNRITANNSGKYSCSLRNFKTTVSEEFNIYIEDVSGPPIVLIIVVSLVSLVFITAAVMLLRRKRKVQGKPMEKREAAEGSLYSTLLTTDDAVYSNITNRQQAEDELQRVSANKEQQNDSTIYCTVNS